MKNFNKMYEIIIIFFFIYIFTKIYIGSHFIIFNKKIKNENKKNISKIKKIDNRNIILLKGIIVFETIMSLIYLFKHNFLSSIGYLILNESTLKNVLFSIIYVFLSIIVLFVFDQMSGVYYRINRVIVGAIILIISFIQLTYFFV